MKIALFLGAGASVPYGMPTTKELKDKIKYGDLDFPRKDLLDAGQFPDIEHVLSVLDQLIDFAESRAGKLYTMPADDNALPADDNALPADDNALPEATTLSQSYQSFAPYSQLRQCADQFKQYVNLSRRSKDIVERLIYQYYKWDPSHAETAEKILGPLLDLAKSGEEHATVFTTNYDTVIEEYCGDSSRQTECIDGFKHDEARRRHVWNGEFVPRNQNCRAKIFLYKLHGSMRWLADEADGRRSIVQKPNTNASADRSYDMYIRPSLDTKDEATQKEPYATILRQFARTLPSFDACVVIGYSFRDPHISKVLVDFARSGKVLVVLSPTAADDFKSNALRNSEPREESEWIGDGRLKYMALESGGQKGAIYALNEKLDKNRIASTISTIKSAIGADVVIFKPLTAGDI